jgi:hypothetical protein
MSYIDRPLQFLFTTFCDKEDWKTRDIINTTARIIQKDFTYYAAFLERKLLNKTVYVADDVSLLDEDFLSINMSKSNSFFIKLGNDFNNVKDK